MPKATYKKTRAHIRYKTSAGKRVPGGSTIAKVADSYDSSGRLIAWANKMGLQGENCNAVRDEAATTGTLAHWLIECHLKGVEPDTSPFSAQQIEKAETCFVKFLSWWDDSELTLVASEIVLVSDLYGYGGTIDIVARDKSGALVLVDLKSSKGIYASAWYQVAGYAELYGETQAEEISRIAIVRIGKEADDDDFEVQWRESWDAAWNVFQVALQLYGALKAYKKS